MTKKKRKISVNKNENNENLKQKVKDIISLTVYLIMYFTKYYIAVSECAHEQEEDCRES